MPHISIIFLTYLEFRTLSVFILFTLEHTVKHEHDHVQYLHEPGAFKPVRPV
jgi:hypothetical protein